MTELTQYTFEGYGLRALLVDSEPWFVAKDACDHLDLANVGQALAGLDYDEKGSITISDGTPGSPVRAIISEAGLYSLILRSRKPEAKAFKRWVTHEVLPSIRKTGQYGAPRQLTDDELIHRALTVSVARVEQLTTRLALVEPKADAFDRWLSSNIDYPVSIVANALAGLGAYMGRNRLFDWLAAAGWIYRTPPKGQWHPKQAQIETGRLSVRLGQQLDTRSGQQFATFTVRITPKGAVEIGRRLGLLPEAVAEALANADEVAA